MKYFVKSPVGVNRKKKWINNTLCEQDKNFDVFLIKCEILNY